MKDFKEKLEYLYKEDQMFLGHKKSKLKYVGDEIFKFTTYDGDATERFSIKMIEVIESIINKTTFEYQEDNYDTYLLMVNMPFLIDKLDWGTSIRGAWMDERKKYKINNNLTIKGNDIVKFLKDVIEWVNK